MNRGRAGAARGAVLAAVDSVDAAAAVKGRRKAMITRNWACENGWQAKKRGSTGQFLFKDCGYEALMRRPTRSLAFYIERKRRTPEVGALSHRSSRGDSTASP